MDSEPKGSDGLIASLMHAPPQQTQRVVFDIAPAAIFKILFTVGALWLINQIFPVILLVALSLMLVATFNPLVRKWQTRLGRSWAIMALVSAMVIVMLGTLGLVIPALFVQAALFAKNAPHYAEQIQGVLAAHHVNVDLRKQVAGWTGKANDEIPQLMSLLPSLVSVIASFVTVGILTIYFLIEGSVVGTSILRLLPRRERLAARKLLSDIGTHVGSYMRGQLITSALAGAFSCVLLLVLQVPAAFALGALAAIADAIPLIGLLVALVPAALMGLTISPAKSIAVVVGYLIYHQLEDHYIAPRIYGNALGLSLTVIVISILIGVQLMGMMGALLALPVAAAIPTIIAYIQDWQETHSAPEVAPLPD